MEPNSQLIFLGAAGSGGEEYWIKYWSFNSFRTPGGTMNDYDNNIVGSGWVYSGSGSIYYPWHWKLNRKGDILYSLVANDYPTFGSAFVTQLPNGGDYVFTNGAWRTRRNPDFTEVSRISGLGGGYITDNSGNSYGGLYSVDSNLSLRWGVVPAANEVARRSDGYIVLASNTPSTPGEANLLVYDSSNGSLAASYKSPTSDHYARTTATDSSGNMYWGGGYSISSYGALIYKLNSSGSLLWYYYKYSIGASYPSAVIGIDFDNDGNVYFWTSSNYLFKLNSSGTIQWCVNIIGADVSSQQNPRSFRVSGSSIYISTRNALLKLPLNVPSIPDGTYGPATFQTVNPGPSDSLSPSWSSYSESQPTYTTPTIGSQFGSFSSGPSGTWTTLSF